MLCDLLRKIHHRASAAQSAHGLQVLLGVEAVDPHTTPHWDLPVAVLTDHERLNTLAANAEIAGQLAAESQTIGIGPHANNPVPVEILAKDLDCQLDRVGHDENHLVT